MRDAFTPDGKLACRSCAADWPMPARYLAHPTLNDGSKGEPWPVCNGHAPAAMCAGWFPLDEIKDQPPMTNKQAYAGLLERLVGPIPTTSFVEGLIDLPALGKERAEAAEAISSLLKDCSYLLACIDMCNEAGAPPNELDAEDIALIEQIRAALNSDAPLSIGEEQ